MLHALNRVERACRRERAALQHGHGIGGRGRRRRFDLFAELLRRVAWHEAQMRRAAVVPPGVRIRGHAEHDRMADVLREKAAAQEIVKIVVAHPARHHAAVLRLGKHGADADAHGLDAVAVEIHLRHVFAEGLGQAVVTIGAFARGGVDSFVLPIETRDVIRAREHDAPRRPAGGLLRRD